ncbi:thioredoxin-like fold domain-containing protein MRL7L, chloroplastic [Cynara cardunculus var. scolymus]|uniref:Thioredoxin-like fold n=1 Tax=Cynara cardunculus var. scolymus TaxID=59895 RepID=A0A103XKC9_CYNCS|nr:thioredoxin-like fold domain-containing protein MRL7L, chloroplastic [Cynara cardunculus var. scolymus]KVH92228.1 Thioredoxin-like fold [Cynara cardunculus var. scolymus]
MSLQCTGLSLLPFSQSVYTKDNVIKASLSFDKLRCTSLCLPRSLFLAGNSRKSSLRASKVEDLLDCDDEKEGVEKSNKRDQSDDDDDGDGDFEMDEDERKELRKKIRQIVENNPEVKEEADPEERRKKMQKLLTDYSLVVDEEDPDWPEDADGWGFNFSQFFDKMTIKNVKKDDDDDDSENEVNWQDIRAVKDITAAEWEETVFSDLSPLVVLVHNRYRRPKQNEMVRDELEKAVQIIWDCRLPSPRCVAIDAVVECDLVSTLGVSVFPELIFTKAGKILHREKETRTADELSKIMAFFYFGAAKPSCLDAFEISNDAIPGFTVEK